MCLQLSIVVLLASMVVSCVFQAPEFVAPWRFPSSQRFLTKKAKQIQGDYDILFTAFASLIHCVALDLGQKPFIEQFASKIKLVLFLQA